MTVFIQCPECATYIPMGEPRQYTACICGRIEYAQSAVAGRVYFDVRHATPPAEDAAAPPPAHSFAWDVVALSKRARMIEERLTAVEAQITKLEQAQDALHGQFVTLHNRVTTLEARPDVSHLELVVRQGDSY